MKKYNLSNIMKRAWELVKKAGLCISEGLKLAWKEAKHLFRQVLFYCFEEKRKEGRINSSLLLVVLLVD